MENKSINSTEGQAVEQAYQKAWSDRYGMPPPPISPRGLKAIRQIAVSYGAAQGSVFMQTYLKMNDPKFIEEAHKAVLLEFYSERIAAELGRDKQQIDHGNGPKIQTELICDKCDRYFTWVGYAYQLDLPRICVRCI